MEEQNSQTQAVNEVNSRLGEIEKKQAVCSGHTQGLKSKLDKQASKVVANAFARTYYGGTNRGFAHWKALIAHEKHKEKILKRTVDHWRKHQFNYVKAAMKNWMLMADIQERTAQLNHKHMVNTY